MARRDTRGLILETALVLFNAEGEPNVTTNHIALEADISPGNLYYHFRHKDDIVLELFKRYLGIVEPLLEQAPEAAVDIEDLWLRLHLLFEARGAYRFVYRNLSDLMDRSKELRRALVGLAAAERRAVATLLDRLAAQGVLQVDPDARTALIDNVHLALTYWIPYDHLFGSSRDEAAPPHAVAHVLLQIEPYLRAAQAEQVRSLAAAYVEG